MRQKHSSLQDASSEQVQDLDRKEDHPLPIWALAGLR